MVFGPSRRVARRTARRTSRRQMAMYEASQPEPEYYEPPPAAAPAAPAEPDYTAELQQLAKLRDSGVITDEEFEAKKKQILGI
ncbi:MAG: SHOCT domain-containing protein [Pseudomonadota bacterium]